MVKEIGLMIGTGQIVVADHPMNVSTQLDTVIFDTNSGFITGNDRIFLNSNLIYCKDVICLNTVGPVIKFHTILHL
ncbi:MAG: hypothetical protein IPO94_18865 [Saprospiraceae bacterium]|nr:hypothetical protein [Saprospiraceae bacterium]